MRSNTQAAAASMHGAGASTSAAAATASTSSSSRRAPAKSSDPYANYSTAEQLGYYVPPPAAREEGEAAAGAEKGTEPAAVEVGGTIGGWQKVVKVPKPKPAPAIADAKPKVEEDGEEAKPDLESAAAAASAEREREEEDRPSTKRWLHDKTTLVDDGADFDPSKIAPLKLKRKVLTLKEEQEAKAAAEKEEEEERRRRKKARMEEKGKAKAPAQAHGTTRAGWEEVEATEEPLLEFEPPSSGAEGPVAAEVNGGGNVDVESAADHGEDVKPNVSPPAPSGFKKRKMLGANAVRRK